VARLGVEAFRYAPLVLLVIAWELAVRYGVISPNFLPEFSAVAGTLWALTLSLELPENLGISMYRQAAGFSLAVVIGVALGIGMARVRAVELAFRPLVTLWYPVPVVALFPVLVLILKLGDQLQITVILLGSILPVILSAYNAARGVDHYLAWSALSMGTSPERLLWKIVLPAALPGILSGIRVTLALSFVLLVASEQLGALGGIGAFTLSAGENGFYTGMFAGILTIGLVGFVADRLYLALIRRLLSWRDEE